MFWSFHLLCFFNSCWPFIHPFSFSFIIFPLHFQEVRVNQITQNFLLSYPTSKCTFYYYYDFGIFKQRNVTSNFPDLSCRIRVILITFLDVQTLDNENNQFTKPFLMSYLDSKKPKLSNLDYCLWSNFVQYFPKDDCIYFTSSFCSIFLLDRLNLHLCMAC